MDLVTTLPMVLKALAPNLSDDKLQEWIDALSPAMDAAQINTVNRIACFLGQLTEESGQFTATRENLNYSAPRLCAVWPSRFPSLSDATPYAYNPEKLANFVYANRMGNGPVSSGDGWMFRGGGPIQLTGRSAFAAFGKTIGKTAEEVAESIDTPTIGAQSACWFWTKNNINPRADVMDVEDVTRIVNGGLINLATRQKYINIALNSLKNE